MSLFDGSKKGYTDSSVCDDVVFGIIDHISFVVGSDSIEEDLDVGSGEKIRS